MIRAKLSLYNAIYKFSAWVKTGYDRTLIGFEAIPENILLKLKTHKINNVYKTYKDEEISQPTNALIIIEEHSCFNFLWLYLIVKGSIMKKLN